MSLLLLPLELKEYILILCTEAGFPTTVAAVAQTCRHFQNMIYHAHDQHLWHRLFLTVFDNPYETRFFKSDDFHWGTAFRERICASLYFTRYAKPLRVGAKYDLRRRSQNLVDLPATYDVEHSQRAFSAILSVIHTSLPSSSRTTSRTQIQTAEDHAPSHPQPHTLGHTSRSTPVFYHSPSPDTSRTSKNVAWLRSVLANGYPPLLSIKLTAETVNFDWDDTAEAHAFYQLISLGGFIPVKTSPDERIIGRSHARGRTPKAHNNSLAKGTSVADAQVQTLTMLDLSDSAQRNRARHLARTRTYNMKYLKRRKHWGPFLPVSAPSASPSDLPAPSMSQNHSEPSGTKIRAHTSSQDLLFSDSDSSDDPDFVPTEDDGTDADLELGSSPASMSPIFPPAHARTPRLAPTPDQLVPDWAWLASARIIVEANLKEMEDLPEGLDALIDLDNVREGAWLGEYPTPDKGISEADEVVDQKGKGRADEDGVQTVREWDWAGAEGVWRRCVCWFDYSDLIHFNYHGPSFDDQYLEEAMLIVPCRLRIVGYSPSPVLQYADRPTIHLEGEMGGAGWSDVWEDTRKLHGTVGVIADGSVRWCLYSTEEGSDEDQWVSEGIQIGGVGSGMGILGMWTGAAHEGSDPLGPFWAWKVA